MAYGVAPQGSGGMPLPRGVPEKPRAVADRERHARFAYLFVGLIVGWGLAQAALMVSREIVDSVVDCIVVPAPVSGAGV